MTLVREVVEDDLADVGVVDAPEDLSVIRSPGCAAAVWRRQPLPSFQSWVDALEPEQLPRARVTLRPEDVRSGVTQICDASGTPDCRERGRLVDDTAALADIFLGLMPAPFVRLRFGVVDTNACRKFHIDVVTARLICTFRGTGTQYGISTGGADPRRIFTVPTGAPILLRGTLWPNHPASGLRHRSPPIEGTGETRLVLVLDTLSESDEACGDGASQSCCN